MYLYCGDFYFITSWNSPGALRRQARRLAVYIVQYGIGVRGLNPGDGPISRLFEMEIRFSFFFHCRRSPTFYRGCGCVEIADIGRCEKKMCEYTRHDVCVMWDGDKNIHRNIQYNTYCTDKRRCRERYKRTGHVQVYGLSSDSRRATCLHRRKTAALALRRM